MLYWQTIINKYIVTYNNTYNNAITIMMIISANLFKPLFTLTNRGLNNLYV